MTRCRFCGEEQARMLRCAKCKTPYCSAACQKRGWKVHKTFCSDDPAMRPVIAVEHAVESGLEWYRRGDAAVPADVHCFICLEGGDGLLHQGCGCRGTSGFAHPECLEKMAASLEDPGDVWWRHATCATCDQRFSGVLSLVMSRKYWRSRRRSSGHDAGVAAQALAADLVVCGPPELQELEAREYLLAEGAKGLPENTHMRLHSDVERARGLSDSGRKAEACELLRTTYRKMKLLGVDFLLGISAQHLVHVLLELDRPGEALPFAAAAVEEAAKGSDRIRLHMAKFTYALALAKNGRRQEAVAILEKELKYSERVYGPNHEGSAHIKWRLAAFRSEKA